MRHETLSALGLVLSLAAVPALAQTAPPTPQAQPAPSETQAAPAQATPAPQAPAAPPVVTVQAAPPPVAPAAPAAPVVTKSISGTVTGPHGPEAGVWVIAETTELPTKFAKIVVTDDKGRYLLPELPMADYSVWVRGYGLVDSPKVRGVPGKRLDLGAVPAPNPAIAAQYYPAIYWYSMVKIPDKSQFGGKSAIPPKVTQQDYLTTIKNRGCVGCHQLGQLGTRTIPAAFSDLDSEGAWFRRITSGQAGRLMVEPAGAMGGVPLHYFAEWTDRIAKGELPHDKPQRPQGVERNVVITEWAWGTPSTYLHDLISTDKRDPTVNAYGPLYGSTEYATDDLPILDPKTNTVSVFHAPVRDPGTPESMGPGQAADLNPMAPSAYWGDKKIWDAHVNNHNSMFDSKGRLWLTAAFRTAPNPDFCKAGSALESAKIFPLNTNSRELTMLDPKTMKYTFVDTCFTSQHLQFGFDKNDTLWASGGGPVLGWLDTKKFDETGDAASSQGWTPFVLDTNADGKRDAYVEPNQPVDPAKDKRIGGGFYAIMPNPADGSVWGSVGVFGGAGGIVRVAPGNDPPATAIAEQYNVPLPGFGPRGADIDSKGIVYVSLGSGHLGRFDRGACKGPLNGPEATGTNAAKAGRSSSIPAPASPASARTAPRRATTPGSISTTRWASATTCRSRPATRTTRSSRSSTANG